MWVGRIVGMGDVLGLAHVGCAGSCTCRFFATPRLAWLPVLSF